MNICFNFDKKHQLELEAFFDSKLSSQILGKLLCKLIYNMEILIEALDLEYIFIILVLRLI